MYYNMYSCTICIHSLDELLQMCSTSLPFINLMSQPKWIILCYIMQGLATCGTVVCQSLPKSEIMSSFIYSKYYHR